MTVPGPENLLEEDIYPGEYGHAAKHNAVNDQVNWLTGQVGGIPAMITAQLAPLAQDAVNAAIYNPPKNLYNPDDLDVTPGQTLHTPTGGLNASASYTTTGYIPVVAGQSYTLSNPRSVVLYDTGKIFVPGSGVDNPAQGNVTVTPAADGYLRASFHTVNYGATFQVEEGPTATSYEPYGTQGVIDQEFAAEVAAAIGSAPLTVTRSGTTITVSETFDAAPLTETIDLSGSSNGALNIESVTLAGVTLSLAGNQGDDITPIRTQHGTLGANHGFTLKSFTNPDAKDATDIGSTWTDGTREYVLLGFATGAKPILGGSYTIDGNGVVQMATVAPTVNLTHVAGATHTAPIVYTTAAVAQLWPSVARRTVTAWVDGEELVTDGTVRCGRIEFRETYDVLDYADLYETAKAAPGAEVDEETVAGAVRVSNTFRYLPGGRRLVSTTLVELAPTDLGVNGFVQAAPMSGTVTRYVPGVGTVGGEDWTAGVPLASHAATSYIASGDLTGTEPPAFSLDVRSDVAFALGYLPYGRRGDEASTNANRLANAPTRLWDMRSTDKNYPTVTFSEAAGWGRIAAESFRAYLTPTQAATVLASKADPLAAWEALDALAALT